MLNCGCAENAKAHQFVESEPNTKPTRGIRSQGMHPCFRLSIDLSGNEIMIKIENCTASEAIAFLQTVSETCLVNISIQKNENDFQKDYSEKLKEKIVNKLSECEEIKHTELLRSFNSKLQNIFPLVVDKLITEKVIAKKYVELPNGKAATFYVLT
jgi:hypothetical protein